jgi:hypothetical protein
VLPENILKAIKEAISAVEIDIQERISNGESFEDLDLMKSELIEMQIEKRKSASDEMGYIIIDSMNWEQSCLKNFNEVRELLRKHFQLRS